MSGLKPFIAKIATRQPLTRQEASDAFEILMSGEASMAQVALKKAEKQLATHDTAELQAQVASLRAAADAPGSGTPEAP